jgi:phosphoenolpyruvate carboxykinase (ATP)
VGITEPEATFSACFGAAFLVWHPTKYAEMLAEKIKKHKANVWLVNTGWTGGSYGVGKRFSLRHTRAIIDAILDGSLDKVKFQTETHFGLSIPTSCPNVPPEVLSPIETWSHKGQYSETCRKLSGMFKANFEKYADQASEEILAGAPHAIMRGDQQVD